MLLTNAFSHLLSSPCVFSFTYCTFGCDAWCSVLCCYSCVVSEDLCTSVLTCTILVVQLDKIIRLITHTINILHGTCVRLFWRASSWWYNSIKSSVLSLRPLRAYIGSMVWSSKICAFGVILSPILRQVLMEESKISCISDPLTGWFNFT